MPSDFTTNFAKASQSIVALFVRQCEHGAQSKPFLPKAAACGQFLDDIDHDQRGLHGTAAAIRVLRQAEGPEARALVAALVEYLRDRENLETQANGGALPQSVKAALEVDASNTVKVGDLLWALSEVPAGLCTTDDVVTRYATSLEQSYISGKGWSEFAGGSGFSGVATAYAILGLSRAGHDVSEPLAIIEKTLRSMMPEGGRIDKRDIPLATLYLYVITFGRPQHQVVAPSRQLKGHFRLLWRAAEVLCDADLEQNIEYRRPGRNHYVRVPWQLYLLALSAHYSGWVFASVALQRRLRSLVVALLSNGGFRYPHSEAALSSRTHAIAFEVISIIRSEKRNSILLAAFTFVDRVRRFLGSRSVRYLCATVALGVIIWSLIASWESLSVTELAPQFIAVALVWLLTFGKRAE